MALYARFAKDPCETRGKGSGKAPRSSAEDGELSRNTTFQEVRRISFRTDLLARIGLILQIPLYERRFSWKVSHGVRRVHVMYQGARERPGTVSRYRSH